MNKKQGLMRHVVIRTGHHSRELMVIFVTNGRKFKQSDLLVQKLIDTFPEITSIKHNINNTHSNVILGAESNTLYGETTINDKLSDVTFKISDQSFIKLIRYKLKNCINLRLNMQT